MRFLADMGISQRVVTWLQEQGHDATHLRDGGLQKLENGEIFTKAFRESRIILTWDLRLYRNRGAVKDEHCQCGGVSPHEHPQ